MDDRIAVVARLRAKEGMEAALKELLLSVIAPGRSDEGCINYELHQTIKDPSLFVFYEIWQSKEHLDKHGAAPHMLQFRGKVMDLLGEPPEIIRMKILSS